MKGVLSLQKRPIWSFVNSIFGNIDIDVRPITLFDTSSNSLLKWKCYSDEEYGGSSTVCISNVTDGDSSYLRFNGNLRSLAINSDLSSSESNARKNTNGVPKASYCALKGDLGRSVDLRDMEGLDIVLRSDEKRSYSLLFTSESAALDQVYTVEI